MQNRDSFRPSDLIVIKRVAGSTLLPLGSFVRLNSGGPLGVVTDLDESECNSFAARKPTAAQSLARCLS